MPGSTESHWGEPPSDSQNNCMECGNPTRSHALGIVEDDDGFFEPAPERGDEDFIIPVCHTCYEEHDGNAEAICESLNERADEDTLREVGITATDMQEILDGVDASETADPELGAVGEEASAKMVKYDVEPGDILHINGTDEPWAVLPVDSTKMEEVRADVVYPLVKVSASGRNDNGGGLVRSRNPMDDTLYHAYLNKEREDVEFEELKEIDVIAHSDKMEDGV